MSIVVIYNEFANETLNFVNEYTYTYIYIYTLEDWSNLAPEKFIAHITFKMSISWQSVELELVAAV